ncbi:MAG: hypothetical protein WDO14_06990 [Bacteroidota bacterium]
MDWLVLPVVRFSWGAYYPGFTFTGSLTEGSSINLTDVMNSLLPVQLKATLILDDLNFVVEPSTGNFSLITGLSGDWKIPGRYSYHRSDQRVAKPRQAAGRNNGSYRYRGQSHRNWY